MRSDLETPAWFVEGDIEASVRNAREKGVDSSGIVSFLEIAEFEDLETERVVAIVESIPDTSDTEHQGPSLSQAPSTKEEPRPPISRWFSVTDFPYLSSREAARVIGLAVEHFDGNTVRPASNDDVECDLYWNRQHMTVGLRVVPTPSWTVSEHHVGALVHGNTNPESTRAPSELVLVTNGQISDEARELAGEHDIHVIDGGHLESWFRRVRLPPEAVGTVLEDGETHDGPLMELVDLPALPTAKTQNPLEVEPSFEVSEINDPIGAKEPEGRGETNANRVTSPTSGNEQGTDADLVNSPSKNGETGTLFADPTEDGDYGAFDRFVDDITPEQESGSSEPQATDKMDGSKAQTNGGPSGPSQTNGDVSRGELLFDLIDAKADAGEPMSVDDVEKYGTYDIEHLKDEFGSVETALQEANIDFKES